jgi:hypothetical protein
MATKVDNGGGQHHPPTMTNINPVLTTAPHQWTTNMTASSLTAASGNSCLDEQIERLKRCEYLREGEVKALCLRAREILVDESNVQRVDAPVTVRSCCYYLRPPARGLFFSFLPFFVLGDRQCAKVLCC